MRCMQPCILDILQTLVSGRLPVIYLIHQKRLRFFRRVVRGDTKQDRHRVIGAIAPTAQSLGETLRTPTYHLAEENLYWCTVRVEIGLEKGRNDLACVTSDFNSANRYLAVVEFEAVEQSVDDVVDGLLQNGLGLRLIGRPSADLLRHEPDVERQAAVG